VNVLVIDIGGSHVKILATGQRAPRRFPSGPALTPARMVTGVKALARGWAYDAIAMGYPGVVRHGRPAADPNNLGGGWTRFDYRAAFGKPVRIVNDAAMQAMGSYRTGTMLFLGSAPASGARWWWTAACCRWSSASSPTARATSRTTWASGASSAAARSGGATTSGSW